MTSTLSAPVPAGPPSQDGPPGPDLGTGPGGPYADQPTVDQPATRWRRLVLGPPGEPRWARPALGGLLLATAALYLAGLDVSGWANAYYSAAAQAGSQSWVTFFFGFLRRRQLDHRRQAAGVAVADGTVGTPCSGSACGRSCCRRRWPASLRSVCCTPPSGAGTGRPPA